MNKHPLQIQSETSEREQMWLGAFLEIGLAVSSSQSFDETLIRIHTATARLMDASGMRIALYEKTRQQLRFVLWYVNGERQPTQERDLEIGRGLTNWVILNCKPLLVRDALTEALPWPPHDSLYITVEPNRPLCSWLGVPLIFQNHVIGALTVRSEHVAWFNETHQQLLIAVANHVAAAIEHVRLYQETEQRHDLLEALHQTALDMQAGINPETLLWDIVQRAIQLLRATAGGLYRNYVSLKEVEMVVAVGLPDKLLSTHLTHGEGMAGRIAQTGEPLIINDYPNWPGRAKVFEPYLFQAVLAVPLKSGQEVEAILFVVDNTGQRKFDELDIELLQKFAAQTSITLANARRLRYELQMASRLELLYQIGLYIQSGRNLNDVLHLILTGVTAGFGLGFNRAMLLTVDIQRREIRGRIGIGYFEKQLWQWAIKLDQDRHQDDLEHYIQRLEGGELTPTPLEESIQSLRLPWSPDDADILNRTVVEQKAVIVRDHHFSELSTSFLAEFEPAHQFALVPLVLQGETIGLLVADNKFTERAITEADLSDLAIFANSAMLAMQLEAMKDAIAAFSSGDSVSDVMHQIVEHACKVFDTRSAALWSYHESQQRFVPAEYMAVGIPEEIQAQFNAEEPAKGGFAEAVLKERWVTVENLDEPMTRLVRPLTKKLLDDLGTKSFLGVSLQADGENLGVLYLNFHRAHQFTLEERRTVETFATHAALALQKARLRARIKRALEIAHVVARLSVLEEKPLNTTLQSVVAGTKEALECDTVGLYTYDMARQKMSYPPILVGVREPERTYEREALPENSLPMLLLKHDGIYRVEDPSQDSLFRDRTFRIREDIQACAAIPLKVADTIVGIMFINYRRPHRFSDDEIKDIKLFANLAAVAIRNVQHYHQLRERANILEVLYKAGQVAAGNQDLSELLKPIIQHACKLTALGWKEDCFGDILLREGDERLIFTQTYPDEMITPLRQKYGSAEDTSVGVTGLIGVTGRAVRTGEVQLVYDTQNDPDFYQAHPRPSRSELAVPIKHKDQVIGVINLEHPAPGVFGKDDVEVIQALAAQVAMAIMNIRLYNHVQSLLEDVRRRARQLVTAAEVSKTASSTLDPEELLKTTVELIRERFSLYYVGVFLVDEGRQFAELQAGTGDQGRALLAEQFKLAIGGPSMIGQCTAQDRPQIESNVEKAEYFYRNPHLPETQSEMALPLRSRGRVIGALTVQSDKPAAFTEDDSRVLQTMADQLANAIDNARQYKELQQIKGYVGSRTAIDWIKMVSLAWGHSIKREVGTARNNLGILRNLVETLPCDKSLVELKELRDTMADLEARLIAIRETPINEPLSPDEGVSLVSVAALVRSLVKSLQPHQLFRGVELVMANESVSDAINIRASREWLRRALEILLENAAEALQPLDPLVKRIEVTTRQVGNRVEIVVADTGPGIPAEIRPHLFKRPIEKPEGAKRAGIGLMLAETIAQTYSGEISEDESAPVGTVMIISLPIVSEQA